MKKLYQKGFAVVEFLLIVLIIGMLGATGWYVYSQQNKPKKSTSTITNFDECVAAGNPIMESYPEQCSANGQTFVKQYLTKNKLTINEWGVQMNLTEPIKEATYTLGAISKDYPGPYAFLSTETLDKSSVCKEYYKPFENYNNPSYQNVSRVKYDEIVMTSDTKDSEIPAYEAAENIPTRYRKVGDHVYIFSNGNGMPCEEQSSLVLPAFEKAFQTIAPVETAD